MLIEQGLWGSDILMFMEISLWPNTRSMYVKIYTSAYKECMFYILGSTMF